MDLSLSLKQTDRKPVVSGSFYSADKETLTTELSVLFRNATKASGKNFVRAIISPHAGYVFSGKIAASALSSISDTTSYKNVFIIGSSHNVYFDGASVYTSGDFISPLGQIKVNKEIGNKLIKASDKFNNLQSAHSQEHSIEVQIPLIQYYFKNEIQIIPIILGTDNLNTIKEIAKILKQWFIAENLFIISSDFSHYPSYNDAIEIDNLTAEAILSGDPLRFQNTISENASKKIPGLSTSMCAWSSGLTLLYLAENEPDLSFRKIAYTNSGDSSYGDKKEVVGYYAIALVDNNPNHNKENQNQSIDFVFTEAEKKQLIQIARESLQHMLNKKKMMPDADSFPAIFKRPLGAFVTLRLGKELKGCIGSLIPTGPLYKTIVEMSIAAGRDDNRFSPLTKDEYPLLNLEISVLSPLKKITNINEIELGKHGIYIKKGLHSGTMLPQVPVEQKWNLNEFLGYTSRDKAGLGWLGWEDAEMYTYEALVIEEKEQ